MANYQNHVVDPTYFFDAIEEFSFDYDAYIVTDTNNDEYGRITFTYEKQTIRGSLQSQGKRVIRDKAGNTEEMIYRFYCKSLYRINNGDFIFYKNRYLLVTNTDDYDEWGVRSAELKMVQLTDYRDLYEYVKYINGDIII